MTTSPERPTPPMPAPSTPTSAAPEPSGASATPEPSTSATPPSDAPVVSASAAANESAPVPVPSAEPVASAAASATDPSTTSTELDPKAALKEKRQSQRALDNGKVADAIEHGEASVKLDPTDAEAWLILGAAYQMKGDLANAKRSFGSCLKEGKRGPRGECAAMPH